MSGEVKFPSWICLVMKESYRHGNRDAALQEIKSVFGESFLDYRLLGDGIQDRSGEYYMLVKCSGYWGGIPERLNKAMSVDRVVPELMSPAFMTDQEVEDFVGSSVSVADRESFVLGDLVLVKTGYLKGLYGLVIGENRGKFRVVFQFHLRRIVENIDCSRLEKVSNVFEKFRFPMV